MSDILCVTNRQLCSEALPERIERLAAAHPAGILLREKDLPEDAYRTLAEAAAAACARQGVLCIFHNFFRTAQALAHSALHLPLPVLRSLPEADRRRFSVLGASCHSLEEAREAVHLGCTYITAGHIFDTACKQGQPGRGLDFLAEICAAVPIPVYAIGGISPDNIGAARAAGAAGGCVMSGAMTCPDPAAYLAAFAPDRHHHAERDGGPFEI